MGCNNSRPLDCRKFVKRMRRRNSTKMIEKEFKQIIHEESNYNYTFDVCQAKENKSKNRSQDTLCYDHSRVIIPNDDGSEDYINASYVDGYRQKKKFICTQTPLQETSLDFWKMIWVHKIRIIIMLDRLTDENNERQCYKYWSCTEGDTKKIGKFEIKTVKITNYRYYQANLLNITDETGYVHKLIHFDCEKRNNFDYPQAISDFIYFYRVVGDTQRKLDKFFLDKTDHSYNPPIVVHCNSGVGKSAVLCAVDICLSKYNATGLIALPRIVANLRRQRYNAISDQRYYNFCYKLMHYYITSVLVDHYYINYSM